MCPIGSPAPKNFVTPSNAQFQGKGKKERSFFFKVASRSSAGALIEDTVNRNRQIDANQIKCWFSEYAE